MRFGSALDLGSSFDSGPQFLDPGAGFGRDGKQVVHFKPLFQGEEIAGALVATETIDFGCDHGKVAACGSQPVEQLKVTLLRGDVGIDEADAEFERGADGEIRLDEGRPARGNRL